MNFVHPGTMKILLSTLFFLARALKRQGLMGPAPSRPSRLCEKESPPNGDRVALILTAEDRRNLAYEENLDGKFLLLCRTKSYWLSTSEVVETYKDLWEIEWAFRDLKSFIEVRPIRHYKDNRVRSPRRPLSTPLPQASRTLTMCSFPGCQANPHGKQQPPDSLASRPFSRVQLLHSRGVGVGV